MSDNRSIGVFDSGLGGLTVARELFRIMPTESIEYLGDTARFPYGGRSEEAVTTFGLQDARFLMGKDIKMLIVACNTVSSVALDHIRDQINDIPVIGVVLPGAKAAVLRSAEKRIGVIGTTATVKTESYARAIKTLDPQTKVYAKACPLFAPLVEEGLLDSDITRKVAQHYLYDLVDVGIDSLILGCTHYPLLMEVIMGTVGTSIQLVDSALWTAKEAQDIVNALNIPASRGRDGYAESSFYLTDFNPNFEASAARFLGRPVENINKISLELLGS
ncbi:MAG: glutamate racemase [Chitinispirillaceae bacterium]